MERATRDPAEQALTRRAIGLMIHAGKNLVDLGDVLTEQQWALCDRVIATGYHDLARLGHEDKARNVLSYIHAEVQFRGRRAS